MPNNNQETKPPKIPLSAHMDAGIIYTMGYRCTLKMRDWHMDQHYKTWEHYVNRKKPVMRAAYWWLCLCQMSRMGKVTDGKVVAASTRGWGEGGYMKGRKTFVSVMMVTVDVCENNKTHWAGYFADECYAMWIINLFKGTWGSVVWYIEVTFRFMLVARGRRSSRQHSDCRSRNASSF